jgi:hypothetical protein
MAELKDHIATLERVKPTKVVLPPLPFPQGLHTDVTVAW